MMQNNDDIIAKYYNDHIKDMDDYETQRWFSRKASIHAYNQTLITLRDFLRGNHFSRTLEIGCGAGTWTKEIQKYSEYVHGIDISDRMIDFAKNKNLQSVKFEVMDFLNLDENVYNNYDCLVSIRMLRFIEDIDVFFKKINTILNENGSCFIVDVNPIWLKRRLLGAKEERLTKLTLRDPLTIKLKMIEYGFKNIQIKSAVIYLPPPLDPWLRLCDKIQQGERSTGLSKKFSFLTESYAIYGHL